ncbi:MULTISPECIES: DNA translocase FtsK [unclassified Janthinobacterium]|uniref:DNA translocase FtsK n=1 Tax=unclassified Janthinobacterium TaxID=2610881 RepID=UPI00160E20A3|nr:MULTISPECIES: DNA translocase FtsK [unclassified Janthinobacterium]MBB5369161.1 S-DNA-T family DNA segregation ATPase FtsK/SpoIIIE [Janthinobacterium sp. K2C7]MBB5381302.1 S-DNA-T family DNA segregation ATPase FtsK/SpoIIIE [Janthinobacterium sp. K2Li3]MBB5387544.1 S-DNA-T family DNA segregation ATPase FtsK/SpoIIIE [Janthinobacterium sp. K2E3]
MTKPAQATQNSYTRKPVERRPLPNRLVRLLSEARWFALAAFALYFVLILASFNKLDPGWSHATSAGKVANLGGRLGANLSDLLLYIFGFSAWWWCVWLLRTVWHGYRRLSTRFLLEQDDEPEREHHVEMLIRIVGFTIMLIGSMGLEWLRMAKNLHIQLPRQQGGVLGQLIGHASYEGFGFTGATLLLLLLFALGFSLFFHVSWLQVAERIGGAIEDGINWFILRYQDREDRRHGEVAAVRRDEAVVIERAKHVEKHVAAPPVKIEPQVVTVVKSERVEKERQATLFENLGDGKLPPLSLLDEAPPVVETVSVETLEFTSRLIEKKLSDFGVDAKVVAAYPGPVVTRYEIEPATGVKGSQIVGLARDLARSLSLTSIRVVETIPGKNYMALELPNAKRQIVRLTEILGSKVYNDGVSSLTIALGKDIAGKPVVADLAKMPHLLVAGTTGSGKSVGINATILSLLYKSDPNDVRLILIDPKMLEMSVYEGIPHLLAPVVTDMRQAGHALNWAVNEMEKRYKLMSKLGVRNLAGYNAKIAEAAKREEHIPNPFSLTPDSPEPLEKLPTIVIIIDELADLMMVVGKKVEELIARIAQKARAAGLHLILATQRPSVDVITGLIKANIPTRIAFQVSSKIDSRTILDQMGAETLLGMGDMLYMPPGTGLPMRVHGAFVSDDEVHRVVSHLKLQGEPNYIEGILEGGTLEGEGGEGGGVPGEGGGEADALYDQAVAVVLKNRRASISLVQRHLRIGYNRAARLLEQMEQSGVVSTMQSNGNREILVPAASAE